MKKYKSNYVFTFVFFFFNLSLSFFPGIFLMWIITNPDEMGSALYIFPLYGVLLVFFLIVGNAIHFLISIFTKYVVFIEDNILTVKGKKTLTKRINLSEVRAIKFSQGTVSKYSKGTPCSISLYTGFHSNSICIENPSFFLICSVIRRCKNAKFSFNNWKYYIISSGTFTFFILFMSLIENCY